MKFLHTSDWHLGRSLHGAPLLEHQRTFLSWLVDLAVSRQVDAVLVAGDVYDRAVPPTDAVAALDTVLAGLSRAGIAVVLTSGNHDSAIRLGFAGALAERAGVHLRTRLADLATPVVLADVAIYGIPYLLPDAVKDELGAERSHTSVLAAAVERITVDAAARGLEKVVAVAHSFVTGGSACDSERDIRVGGIGDAPVGVFAGLTYTALGHLHGAQQVGEHVRYSGSPLAFSFSERDQVKSVTLVDIDADGSVRTELVPTPVPHALREVRGRLEDLLVLDDDRLVDAWLKVVLTDARRPMAPMERLREKWTHTLVLEFQPEGEQIDAATDLARRSEVSDPVEICSLFVEWVDSTYPDKLQHDALRSAVAAVRRAEASA